MSFSISGGELYEYLINSGPFDEEETFEIFKQILDAVCYMHKVSVACK
jgi:serine/threonine protein kinase